jgi:hypothetical protein
MKDEGSRISAIRKFNDPNMSMITSMRTEICIEPLVSYWNPTYNYTEASTVHLEKLPNLSSHFQIITNPNHPKTYMAFAVHKRTFGDVFMATPTEKPLHRSIFA